MKSYMPTVGSMGLDMMFRTCTVQVGVCVCVCVQENKENKAQRQCVWMCVCAGANVQGDACGVSKAQNGCVRRVQLVRLGDAWQWVWAMAARPGAA